MGLRSAAFRALSFLAVASGCERAPEVFPLWPQGAPGFEARRDEPELAKDWWVANVHNPSLTLFRAESARSSGAAVVILPGGGHERLVFGPEGREPARFFAQRGVSAFVLKYRLARAKGSPYGIEEHARADALRAVRWVRQRARDFDVNPERVGVMGWSAGGELAAMVSYGPAAGNPAAPDPVDRLSGRPDFQILIYPGKRGLPAALEPDAPRAFLLAARDDPEAAETVLRLSALYQQASLPVELHLFERGGHGFNMGRYSQIPAIRHWPQRLEEWLGSSGLLRSAR